MIQSNIEDLEETKNTTELDIETHWTEVLLKPIKKFMEKEKPTKQKMASKILSLILIKTP